MQCLTLMATVGENPEWNSRKNSAGHKAIPLPSAEFVAQIPMIAQLIGQFGLDPSMVVGTDGAVRTAISRDLESKGLSVIIATDEDSALHQVAQHIPRLILLDPSGPGMDGFAFLDSLRKNPEWLSIPVIVVAGDDLPQDLESQHGNIERVLPETRPQDLLAQIADLVERSR